MARTDCERKRGRNGEMEGLLEGLKGGMETWRKEPVNQKKTIGRVRSEGDMGIGEMELKALRGVEDTSVQRKQNRMSQ